LDAGRVVIVTGFQGLDEQGQHHDMVGAAQNTSVAVAAAMKAEECLIFTDVDGVWAPRTPPSWQTLVA
jgi:aspartate kinase